MAGSVRLGKSMDSEWQMIDLGDGLDLSVSFHPILSRGCLQFCILSFQSVRVCVHAFEVLNSSCTE